MTFLAPWALWAAGAVSAAVIALHILASRNPRKTPMPTTRFIPDVPLRATARALRLSDVLLLALRVAVVMLVGLAFARPVPAGARRSVGRVVMLDASRASDRTEALDSARAHYQNGDRFFVFDSAATESRIDAPIANSGARGSISAALAAGMRAASSMRGEADSVELVLISSFRAEELDAATNAIRTAWPGRVRVVRTRGLASGHVGQAFHDVRATTIDDAVRAALAFSTHLDTGRIKKDSVRIERGNLASVDTSWTQRGRTLVRWPAVPDSSGFSRRARIDTAGAVIAGTGDASSVVVFPFARAVDPGPGRVVARWSDGSPAATERRMMNGCVRDVAIPLAHSGDLALRESTRRLVTALSAPCDAAGELPYAPDSAIAQLAGSGPLVATRALESRTAPTGHIATWLLSIALALLLLEPLLRRAREKTAA